MSFIYIDTETTGLTPRKHEVWEIAWAWDDEPIESIIVPHSLINADEVSLEVCNYHERVKQFDAETSIRGETDLLTRMAIEKPTFIASNPHFDASFLTARWITPAWHYRLFDIEAYAMGAMGLEAPPGLWTIQEWLSGELGYNIPQPDHTGAGDVNTLRECHRALRDIYSRMRGAA